ncbi:MAG: hypothetical protein AB1650_08330 [Candidatus Omnitrophota bacterium]
MGHGDRERNDFSDGGSDLNVLGILRKLQQQMAFLERKIDRLMEAMEGKPNRERNYSRFSGEHKTSYGSKDRKFSRGYSKDDDRPAKERGQSSFGKPFGKSFGKSGMDKKNIFPAKKKI